MKHHINWLMEHEPVAFERLLKATLENEAASVSDGTRLDYISIRTELDGYWHIWKGESNDPVEWLIRKTTDDDYNKLVDDMMDYHDAMNPQIWEIAKEAFIALFCNEYEVSEVPIEEAGNSYHITVEAQRVVTYEYGFVLSDSDKTMEELREWLQNNTDIMGSYVDWLESFKRITPMGNTIKQIHPILGAPILLNIVKE